MSYYDEEFYDAPSEFEEQILTLKESLATSIKSEFVAEMERLRAENAELQKAKKDWESIQREYADKARQLERDRKKLENEVRGERLSKLLGDCKVVMYRAYSKRSQGEKCDKCNRYRRVAYTTPLGRKAEEDCRCGDWINTFVPEEYVRYEFGFDRWNHVMQVWYRIKDEDREEWAIKDSVIAKTIYQEGCPYESLDYRETFFSTQEQCQAYCDWLNANGGDK